MLGEKPQQIYGIKKDQHSVQWTKQNVWQIAMIRKIIPMNLQMLEQWEIFQWCIVSVACMFIFHFFVISEYVLGDV